jgi:DeoR/GlpR family transcriptional regulator of sugar metabolism
MRAIQIRRENSPSAFLMLDYSKSGPAAPVRGGKVDEATKILRDKTPPAAILALIKQSGLQLIICGD